MHVYIEVAAVKEDRSVVVSLRELPGDDWLREYLVWSEHLGCCNDLDEPVNHRLIFSESELMEGWLVLP